MNAWTASLISGCLMGGLAVISVKWFGADFQSTVIVSIFCAVIAGCMIVAEDENRDRMDK